MDMKNGTFDAQFCICVLRINNGGKIPDQLYFDLKSNATFVEKYQFWLFEGDWEFYLEPWIEAGVKIECVGEIITGSLGDLSQVQLESLVEDFVED